MNGQVSMEREVLNGLCAPVKHIHPKYLYDDVGSKFFEQITELDEYYVTKTENRILREHGPAIARLIGPGALIIEPGSGTSEKVRFLLEQVSMPVGYVPVEISSETLRAAADMISTEFPRLPVFPVCADFTAEFALPEGVHCWEGRKIIFFPGSTIGNFDPSDAVGFLKKMFGLMGHDGGMIVGVDMKKPRNILHRAYDDSDGITAAFNLNLLSRLNRELEADFDLSSFVHEAVYDEEKGRVEMHLVSVKDQSVLVKGKPIAFRKGETIHTENSYKYSVSDFCWLAGRAGLTAREWWQDPDGLFCVFFLERRH